MKAVIATLLALLGIAAASGGSGTYQGRYAGKCGNDGFYYNNYESFVICSNGNAYNQPCAPGSRNSGQNNYNRGNNYGYADFCDVNLVDYGYGANSGYGDRHQGYGDRHQGYGQRNQGYGYGSSSYGYGGYDSYRPERYLNADGYATRGAYNAYNRYDGGYGGPAHAGRGYGDNSYASRGYGDSYGKKEVKTVVKKVSYNKH